MLNEVFSEQETKMSNALDALKKDLATLRTGRATPGLLDKIMVEYYGSPTPINQLANVSAPEARLLVIQPWDKTILPEIEKAISKSDINLTPNSDGTIIRIAIPQLTEERRKEIVKVVKKKAEEAKVSIRNIRRDANDEVKLLEKEGEISEDEQRKAQDKVQEMTDKFIKMIEETALAKEEDVMEV